MELKSLLVEIFLDDSLTKSDLDLRHILVDTIESRNLGEVVEETSSPEMLEIIIEHPSNKSIEKEVRDLISSLGFNNYKMSYIPIDN